MARPPDQFVGATSGDRWELGILGQEQIIIYTNVIIYNAPWEGI